ncbi:hypothetical protein Tco_0183331 [Tanacetum coccineum]
MLVVGSWFSVIKQAYAEFVPRRNFYSDFAEIFPEEEEEGRISVGGVTMMESGLNEGNTVNLDMKDYGENERDDNSFVNLEDVGFLVLNPMEGIGKCEREGRWNVGGLSKCGVDGVHDQKRASSRYDPGHMPNMSDHSSTS